MYIQVVCTCKPVGKESVSYRNRIQWPITTLNRVYTYLCWWWLFWWVFFPILQIIILFLCHYWLLWVVTPANLRPVNCPSLKDIQNCIHKTSLNGRILNRMSSRVDPRFPSGGGHQPSGGGAPTYKKKFWSATGLCISIRSVSEVKNSIKIWQSVYPQSSVRPVGKNIGQAERSLCQKVFNPPWSWIHDQFIGAWHAENEIIIAEDILGCILTNWYSLYCI